MLTVSYFSEKSINSQFNVSDRFAILLSALESSLSKFFLLTDPMTSKFLHTFMVELVLSGRIHWEIQYCAQKRNVETFNVAQAYINVLMISW